MNLPNNFKKNIAAKQPQYGMWLSTASPYVAEIAATSKYDWYLIDGEHAPNTIQSLHGQLQAMAPYKGHPVVRVVEGTKANIKQALDIGAQTLLIPMVDTAEQAQEVVDATRYAPQGTRGVGAGVARAARWGRVENYMAEANEDICILIQVESKTAVENLNEILKVEGIDGVFIGPADLSASLGYPDQAEHENVQAVIKKTIDKILASGKAVGFLAPDPAVAKRAIEWGVTFIAVGVDTMLYTQALDDRLNLFKQSNTNLEVKSSY
ncbi:aldolase/citrate lyase family protein [Acinetobacter nematophilus]|uniref:Aldolase/citrate lyase family protein n=1 Tax=Acinetobacter nematophilus TaxID=2994642 RepID=A0A9X3E612_9GAMM|nr:aldolase/citrate lyase family protein [Acinetobacter nematophilus]MCX5470009.1 aldolase/citrate lyase family protein [Acinetobacter nematophilus]